MQPLCVIACIVVNTPARTAGAGVTIHWPLIVVTLLAPFLAELVREIFARRRDAATGVILDFRALYDRSDDRAESDRVGSDQVAGAEDRDSRRSRRGDARAGASPRHSVAPRSTRTARQPVR
jgi:hypothetical protein